jgi:acyl-CoA thioesterase FadM
MTDLMEKPIEWIEEHRVDAHDVDYQGLVRPSVMLRYIQDAAGHAHHCLGPTLEDLREKKMAYILSKVSMKLYALPRVYDRIRAVTWITPIKGFSFNRYGRIWRGDELLAEMSSVWALTDISDPGARKLLRGDSVKLNFGTGEPLSLGFPARFRIPNEIVLTEAGVRPVLYADCDENRHMNNTVYPDMFCGYAEIEDGMRVSEFEVTYQTEAPMGDCLTICRGVDENRENHYFRSFRLDGKINAEARMVFTKE